MRDTVKTEEARVCGGNSVSGWLGHVICRYARWGNGTRDLLVKVLVYVWAYSEFETVLGPSARCSAADFGSTEQFQAGG